MKYLITGGAGFIGSHLTEALLDKGEEVYVLDDLSTGRIENLDKAKECERFHYHIGSITSDEQVLAELIDRVDVIYHLAAAVGVRLIVERPVHTIETNIAGTEWVLRLAAKKKKKVILASTSEVYGKTDKIPFREDADMVLGPTVKCRWSYACSKAVDEFLGLSYWREFKVPVIIFRLFNTVGPRQVGHYGMVIPRFVEQALKGGPITVYGDGTQSRCFTYVSNVVDAFVGVAHTEEAVGQVFNIGSSEEISIQALAEKIRDKIDPKIEIIKVPYEEAYEEGFEDMQRRVPDLSKAQSLLNYQCTYTIDEILDRVIAHFKKE